MTSLRTKVFVIALVITVQTLLMLSMLGDTLSHSNNSYESISGLLKVVAYVVPALSALCCFAMIPDLKKQEIPLTGAILTGAGFFLSIVVYLIFSAAGIDDIFTASKVAMLLLVVQYALLWRGTRCLAWYIDGLGTASAGYFLIGVGILLFCIILAFVMKTGANGSSALGTVCSFVMLFGYLATLVGWWKSVGGARNVDRGITHDDEEEDDSEGAAGDAE